MGTATTMLVVDHRVAVPADAPLKVTVLAPCVAPKFVPVMVTLAPTAPLSGVKLVIVGVGKTVNVDPLLATPLTLTTTLPVVAPAGTGTTMLVALQVVTVPAVPLKVTVLLPCVAPKLVPVMVTAFPTPPEVGLRLVIEGVASTVNALPLLATPPTVTTTLPVDAPAGTGTTMLVELQVETVPAVPLKVTVLLPCVAPKFVPVMVTEAPTSPDVGLRLLMAGAGGVVDAEFELLAHPVTPSIATVASKRRHRPARRPEV
jgi:hypothetical protein